MIIVVPHLPPSDGWYIRVSRSSTGDNELSPGLLTVLPPRPYIKVRGILYKQQIIMGESVDSKTCRKSTKYQQWCTFSTKVAGGDMPMVPRAL